MQSKSAHKNTDGNVASTNTSIDISSYEKIVFWANKLNCTVDDLRFAVGKIGTNYNCLDYFLALNRKKIEGKRATD